MLVHTGALRGILGADDCVRFRPEHFITVGSVWPQQFHPGGRSGPGLSLSHAWAQPSSPGSSPWGEGARDGTESEPGPQSPPWDLAPVKWQEVSIEGLGLLRGGRRGPTGLGTPAQLPEEGCRAKGVLC